MPSQSITEDKGDYVNQRNLTLKDLLVQLKHYNKNVRKGTDSVSFSCYQHNIGLCEDYTKISV